MDKFDWGKLFQGSRGLLAGIFTAVLGVILVAWPAVLTHSDIQIEAERRAEQRIADARDEILEKCGASVGVGRRACSRPIEEAARAAQRGEYELAAQQAVAVWTAVMGGVAVLGVALSGLGIFLVWTTFAETRKANQIAQDSAMRQLRAYIAVQALTAPRLVPGFAQDFAMTLTLVNSGPTPAVRWVINYCWKITGADAGEALFKATFDEYGHGLGTLADGDVQYAFGPSQTKSMQIPITLAVEQVSAILTKAMRLYFMASIEYIDVYGVARSTECFYAYNVETDPVFGQMRWHNRMT